MGGTSKLLPLFEKQGRWLLWRFGYGDGLFAQLGFDKKLDFADYDKIPKMPMYNNVDAHKVRAFADLILKLGSVADNGVANCENSEQLLSKSNCCICSVESCSQL